MNKFSVSRTRADFRLRAATATSASNPALIAYVVYMLCLTATVIL
jgi:hypothetical protein